jgi:hypothetical protein
MMAIKRIYFNQKLKFEILRTDALIVYGSKKYFLVKGISADLVKMIILMQIIDVDELKFYAHSKYKKEKFLDKKIDTLIDSLLSFGLVRQK